MILKADDMEMKDITNRTNMQPDEMATDYKLLRAYALDCISRLSGSVWSDHNIHDPGITILEHLCFAVTDLGYRASFDIKDILTPAGKNNPEIEDAFPLPDQILSSHPITIDDYRKALLKEIPYIRNIWLTPVSKEIKAYRKLNLYCFYQIIADMPDIEELKKYRTIFGRTRNGRYVGKEEYEGNCSEYVKAYIRNKAMKYRNLCEDIDEIILLKKAKVALCLNVEIKPYVKYEPVVDEINRRIAHYINHKDIDISGDDRLNGSDIINLIMSMDGVVNIGHFHFVYKNKDVIRKVNNNDFCIKLISNNYSFLYDSLLNEITVRRGSLTFKVENRKVFEIKKEETIPPAGFLLPVSKNRSLNKYYSIQNEFPKIFRLGKEGLLSTETPLRKAQRLQLKAFMIFFDQLMADFLEQLNAVGGLLSWRENVEHSYFHHPVTNHEIVDFTKIVPSYTPDDKPDYADLIDPETLRHERRNRLLDHLIARFNEEFVDYSILKNMKEGRINSDFDEKEAIKDKIVFLKTYAETSANRSHAIDYTNPPGIEKNPVFPMVSDNCMLELRLYAKLGIDMRRAGQDLAPQVIEPSKKGSKIVFLDNRTGSYNQNFGLHIYEHHLFSPLDGFIDKKYFLQLVRGKENRIEFVEDPYSMQITVVVPGWLEMASNLEFKNFVEQTVRMEIPAHIAVKICWLNPLQMYELEERHKKFMKQLAKRTYMETDDKWKESYLKSLADFIEIFSTLHNTDNVFPSLPLNSSDDILEYPPTFLDYARLQGDEEGYEWKNIPVKEENN
jgi:hypothetical protein